MRPEDVSTHHRPRTPTACVQAGPVLLALAAVVLVAWAAWAGPSAVWDYVQANLDGWRQVAERRPATALVVFFMSYAVLSALPAPVLTIMTLLAGWLFGPWLGLLVASLAYTAGVTSAFLATRWLLREPARRRFGPRLRAVERGFAREGAYYLLALRLTPVMPFFLVNVLFALTPIGTVTFAFVSWLGGLPLKLLYAGMGAELASMTSPAELLSPRALAYLAALGLMPLLGRWLMGSAGPGSSSPSMPTTEGR